MMLDEFFSIKLDDRVCRVDRPRIAHEAWHAGPREKLYLIDIQCKSDEKLMSRLCQSGQGHRFHAATSPPRHPTAIPPSTTKKQSSHGRKRTDDRLMAEANGTRYRALSAKNAANSTPSAINAPIPPCRTPSITNGPRM